MISVIIPIYNVEEYVSGCIKSVIAQEYTDLEIILVDDGSTDNSGNICDEFAKKDKRIIVVHKKNGGLSDARNAGMKIASGEYMGFVDGDDRISPKMYSRLIKTIEDTGADIAECRYVRTDDPESAVNDPETTPRIFNTEDALKELILERDLTQTTVNKIYKRDVILSLSFIKGIYNEDEFWTYKVFAACGTVAFIDERLYYYFQREGSIINSDYNIKRLDGIKALYERIGFVEKNFPALTPYARSSYLGNCFYAYQKICGSKIENDLKKKLKKELITNYRKESKKTIINPSGFKSKMWRAMFKALPDTTCFLRNKLKIGL